MMVTVRIVREIVALVLCFCVFFGSSSVFASTESGTGLDKSLMDLKISMLAYIDYSLGQAPLPGGEDEDFNVFRITRGYITLKKKILKPWFSVRATLDIHQDDSGDYKFREKYLYAEFKIRDLGFFTNLISEVGISHMPWLDFEEHINPFRCQGTMAIERAGVFNSADLGIGLMGYFGGELENAVERTGSHYYTGKYGSWHIGIYNGSGYHGIEDNENKAVEGRITVRPLKDSLPGLQVSYLGIMSKGNKLIEPEEDEEGNIQRDYPDYNVHLGMLSYEHPMFIATGQYFVTEGEKSGKWTDEKGNSLDTEGYSFFLNVKIPNPASKFSVFGRYDYFDADKNNVIADASAYEMIIAGVVYDFYKGNLLLFSFENTDYEADAGKKGSLPSPGNNLGDEKKVQFVLQVKY